MRVAYAVVCVWMTACALLTDLGELSGPSDGTTDAPSETSVSDVVEAGGDVARTSPCTAVHTFCDDFDDDAGLGAKWDGVLTGSGPLALSSAEVVTLPRSLQATGTVDGKTALVKNLPASNHTHIEFDLLIQAPQTTTGTEVDFITIEILQPPSPWGYADLGFSRQGGTCVLEEYESPTDGGVATRQDVSINETFGAWRHVALDLTFSTQKLAVTIDGTAITTMTFAQQLVISPLGIAVGAPFVANTSGAWNVFIDDFVVDQN